MAALQHINTWPLETDHTGHGVALPFIGSTTTVIRCSDERGKGKRKWHMPALLVDEELVPRTPTPLLVQTPHTSVRTANVLEPLETFDTNRT